MDYNNFLVMIIEDDANFRNLLKKLIEERIGAQCVAFGSSIEGFKYFTTKRPDLIILDLMLPDMHGIVAVERLRGVESTKRIPILVCSGISERETITCLAAYGVRDFLLKPVDLLVAMNKIKSMLPDPDEYELLDFD